MTQKTFDLLEGHMLACMGDSAHDAEHVRRVLFLALEIAESEPSADRDVLIAACLLHDIARGEQFADPAVCHARRGAERARTFLLDHGFGEDFARRVSDCIRTHRYRSEDPPASLEARILFDADKLDVTGAVGIARTFLYQGHEGIPLYLLGPNGRVSGGAGDGQETFFREYKFKLEGLYGRFLTRRGAELARERQEAAAAFYEALLREVSRPYETGPDLLAGRLE